MHVEPVDDWNDDEFLYCTEFLLHGDELDQALVADYVSEKGGSELVVGGGGTLKIHVHTNEPGVVLSYMTELGEVSQVHINNMRRQQKDRDAALREEAPATPAKPVGFVTVASGDGLVEILRSLGADVIVSGGQTMNPSTRDLLDAVESVNAERVVILPNNKNIVMSANAAASEADRPTAVVPTTAIPQAFAALLAYEPSDDFDSVVEAMAQASVQVRCGEVTTAVKDAKGKVGDIVAGQVIGIADHEIEAVGDDVATVAFDLAATLITEDTETLTILAGEEFNDGSLRALADRLSTAYVDVEVETHRGDQPLYPVLLSAE